MENILNFLIEIGKLKGKKRRGWIIHQIKNSETTAEHIFRLAFLSWFLGKKKRLNLERVIKTALVHDLCEVYSRDFTSYDAAALDEKGKITIKELLAIKPKKGRPTHRQRKKLEKIKQRLEKKAMERLIFDLPSDFKKEVKGLWMDYEEGKTREARFVKQADKIENFLQGMEYWKKYGKIEHELWLIRIKEVVDDPVLIEFIKEIERSLFLKKKKRKSKK